MLIYLTGYMGSGKSRYGRDAARRLGYGFIDLDALIEERAGMSIPAIFAGPGEAAFRLLEQTLLTETLPGEDTLMATGGGTPCSDANLAFMKRHGKLVYIQLSAGALAARLKTMAPTRPLLTPHLDHLTPFVASHLAQREPWYLQAHLIVQGVGLTGKKLADEIQSAILQRWPER
jgi:shikimate kinase